MRALICDDDATIRVIARRVLEEQFGCAVVECTDGVEALGVLTHTPCQFALLDVDMPGMGGLETLEEIRASETLSELPVIILTAERDEQTVIKLMQLGVADYIVKPLRHASFVAKIDGFLRTLPREQAHAEASSLHIDQGHPALIADGDPTFRAFLAEGIQSYGEVVQVDSAAAALMAFRRAPAAVVFIGSNLGVMSSDRLASKIREAKPWGVRLVRIVERDDDPAGDNFDAVLVRSQTPESLKEALKPFAALDQAS